MTDHKHSEKSIDAMAACLSDIEARIDRFVADGGCSCCLQTALMQLIDQSIGTDRVDQVLRLSRLMRESHAAGIVRH